MSERTTAPATTQTVVVENLTRSQIVQYAGASGDFNPIHTDEIYATQAAGYPSVFAHGMLTMGLTGTALIEAMGPGFLRSYEGRFRAQVWPGDTLTVTTVVADMTDDGGTPIKHIRLTTTNQNGIVVFEGHAGFQPAPP